MFNKILYTKSDVWDGDKYLVQPSSAVKACRCCGESFYSVEFPNVPEAIDGKLPVCLKCFRSRKSANIVSGILADMSETRICRKCNSVKHITDYLSYRSRANDFDNRCSDCRPAAKAWWDDVESDE